MPTSSPYKCGVGGVVKDTPPTMVTSRVNGGSGFEVIHDVQTDRGDSSIIHVYHTIVQEDTLESLSKMYETPRNLLIVWNHELLVGSSSFAPMLNRFDDAVVEEGGRQTTSDGGMYIGTELLVSTTKEIRKKWRTKRYPKGGREGGGGTGGVGWYAQQKTQEAVLSAIMPPLTTLKTGEIVFARWDFEEEIEKIEKKNKEDKKASSGVWVECKIVSMMDGVYSVLPTNLDEKEAQWRQLDELISTSRGPSINVRVHNDYYVMHRYDFISIFFI